MTMPTIHKILTTIALCLAAAACTNTQPAMPVYPDLDALMKNELRPWNH